jgi:hypothetical protein
MSTKPAITYIVTILVKTFLQHHSVDEFVLERKGVNIDATTKGRKARYLDD